MPLRLPLSPLQQSIHLRTFHTTRILYEATHYETLNVPINATPAEIKKSFYALSKTHHPDLNPNDPKASEAFVKISNAYHVLGNQAERQKYDRDHLPRQTQRQAPQGSYSSSSYQPGGRSPSGLSKRRTTFRGPPPSFYRSGGWGDHAEKRRGAAEETASNARASTEHHNDAGPSAGYSDANEAGEKGGMGYGQNPFGGNDVPHFDKEGHLRTHSNHEQRRRSRSRKERDEDIQIPEGILGSFFVVGGIICFAMSVPAFFR